MGLGVKRVGGGQSDFPRSGLDVSISGCANKMGKQYGVGLRRWAWEWQRVDLRPVFNADLHSLGKLIFHQQNTGDGCFEVILAPFTPK